MRFKDRAEAARLLLGKLEKYRGTHPLILGIPRGAVPMAKIIADGLNGELGAILVHKIPAPGYEELAIASIGLSGDIQRLYLIDSLGIPETYVQKAANEQLDMLKHRQRQYGLKDPDYQDRIVIIVDDGIATGATTLSAIHEVRHFNPKTIVVASPVASIEAAKKITEVADETVLLDVPADFYAVGQFYDNFDQVSDDEVIGLLRRFAPRNDK